MSEPKKVGEGSYGCVHNPPLKCKDKPVNRDKSQVSKILTKQNASDELKEFKLINSADEKGNFHLGNPKSCLPDTNIDNKIAIDECNNFDSNNINNYKLLLLKNGGKDLEQIDNKFKLLKQNNQNRRKLEQFWLDMSRILYGSNVLSENGIVHHDIKRQNIVYNEDTGRVNFIDFGLMTTIEKMKKEAARSNYEYSAHWSFPPEIVIYDYINYSKLTRYSSTQKELLIQELYNKYLEHLQIRLMIDCAEDSNNTLKRISIEFIEMCRKLKLEDYNEFIMKSFKTFDNFGIGFSLLSILKHTTKLIDPLLRDDLNSLFKSMINFNVFERPSSSEVVVIYENILKTHGLLEKYNMRFEKNFLVEGTENKEQEKKIEELPKSLKKYIDELIIKCPVGKEQNPKTKRCINNCKEGYKRDTEFKCKRNKTQKKVKEVINLVSTESLKTIPLTKHKTQKKKEAMVHHWPPLGKELNPKTGRYINKCKEGYTRDADFKCKKDKNKGVISTISKKGELKN